MILDAVGVEVLGVTLSAVEVLVEVVPSPTIDVPIEQLYDPKHEKEECQAENANYHHEGNGPFQVHLVIFGPFL